MELRIKTWAYVFTKSLICPLLHFPPSQRVFEDVRHSIGKRFGKPLKVHCYTTTNCLCSFITHCSNNNKLFIVNLLLIIQTKECTKACTFLDPGPRPSKIFRNMQKYSPKTFLGVKPNEISHDALMDWKKPKGLLLQSVITVDWWEVKVKRTKFAFSAYFGTPILIIHTSAHFWFLIVWDQHIPCDW